MTMLDEFWIPSASMTAANNTLGGIICGSPLGLSSPLEHTSSMSKNLAPSILGPDSYSALLSLSGFRYQDPSIKCETNNHKFDLSKSPLSNTRL